MSLKNEGSMAFVLQHEHTDWPTNAHGYNFGAAGSEGVTASAVKYPDKTLEIQVTGPFDEAFTFRQPAPECGERGLPVALTWKGQEVTLYLDGKAVETLRANGST